MNKFLSFFTKKRLIYGTVILAVLVAGYFIFFNKKNPEQTLTVHPADFLQQVSASGKVVAKDNLNLSFEQSGQVSGVSIAVGDTVYPGQLLVSQNASDLGAQVSQMQAGIDLQQARLDQLLAGASPEDIQTAQSAVDYANQNVTNGYTSAANSLNTAYNAISNAYTTANYIQQTYFNTLSQESFQVKTSKDIISAALADSKKYVDVAQSSLVPADIDNALAHIVIDINTTYDNLVIIRQECEVGVYYSQVSAADKASIDTQKTTITSSLSSVTSAQSTISSYKTALLQAQDALALKKSPARPADIAIYQAQLAQAKASLENVYAQINKKRIYSPITGIVTAVNAKVGSVFSSQDPAISVISKNNFQIESYVPQINISLISVGQAADITLDSYGDTVFGAKVISINPAETIKDGVSTYKVTLEFTNNNDTRIRSGMTGNIIITTLEKPGVISVPQGIVISRDGQKFVKVKQQDTTVEKQITTGSVASNGNVEVLTGLQDGDVVVLN